MFRILFCPPLALPSELVIRYKMVDVLMIVVHVLFGQGDQKKYLRLLYNESCIPYRLTEGQTECRCYCLAGVAFPNLQSLRGADSQRLHFKTRWAAL